MTPVEHELTPLLIKLIDGELFADDAARLNSLLQEHADARELYRRHVEMHTLLEWTFTPPEFAKPASVRSEAAARRWGPWIAATAAGVLVTLGIYAAFQAMRPHPVVPAIAQITDAEECRWADNARPDAALYVGQTLELIEGVAAVQFRKGKRVVLEAPCRVVIRGDAEMTLSRGKVTASDPVGAGGFTIESSVARIVDRGAEFGMQVLADDSVEIHVFTGKVEAHPASDAPMIEVQAKQALRIDSDQSRTRGPAEPGRFAKTKADRLVSVRLKKWYALGPLGHPRLKERPKNWSIPPNGAKETRNYNLLFSMFARSFGSGLYPMDPGSKGVIDLDAKHKGELTQDVAGIQSEVKWVRRDLDRDPVAYPAAEQMKKSAGLAYFSTWIHLPQDSAAEIEFHGYGQEPHGKSRLGVLVAAWVNGRGLRAYRIAKDNPMVTHPVDQQAIELKQGWNHILCRHASAWEGIRNDVRLQLPGEIAANVEISADPPRNVGRRFRVDGKAEPN